MCPDWRKISLNYDNCTNKKHRVSSIKVRTPILINLYEFGIITSEILSNFIYQKFVLFLNFKECDNNIVIEFLYFINVDDMSFHNYVIEGTSKNWFFIFKKMFLKIIEIGKLINKKKDIFFKDSICNFENIMKHSINKGTIFILYKKFKYYLNTLSVYGYNFSQNFINYMLCTAHILNEKCKTKKFGYKLTDNNNLGKFWHSNFLIRDFKQLINPLEIDSEETVVINANIENKRDLSGFSFIFNLGILYNDCNYWLYQNFTGFEFDCTNNYTVGSHAYELLSYFSTVINKMHLGYCKMSPEALHIFSQNSQGGIGNCLIILLY